MTEFFLITNRAGTASRLAALQPPHSPSLAEESLHRQPVLRGGGGQRAADVGADGQRRQPLLSRGHKAEGRHLLADRPRGTRSRRQGDVLPGGLSPRQVTPGPPHLGLGTAPPTVAARRPPFATDLALSLRTASAGARKTVCHRRVREDGLRPQRAVPRLALACHRRTGRGADRQVPPLAWPPGRHVPRHRHRRHRLPPLERGSPARHARHLLGGLTAHPRLSHAGTAGHRGAEAAED